MTRRSITGFSNPTVKAVRALREKKHRKREGRFLAEGLRLLTDALESGRVPDMLLMAEAPSCAFMKRTKAAKSSMTVSMLSVRSVARSESGAGKLSP